MYGTFSEYNNREVSILLNNYADITIDVWNLIINKLHIQDILTLGALNRQLYNQVFRDTFISIATCKCKSLCHFSNVDELLHHTRKIDALNQFDYYNLKKTAASMIYTNTHKACTILKNASAFNLHIMEQDYIYLSNMYSYKNESLLQWQCKGYGCLAVYIPCLIIVSPILCLTSSCLIVNEFLASMSHDAGEYDPYYLRPFDVCDARNQYKTYGSVGCDCPLLKMCCTCLLI
jgi:hypothetical protein